MGGGTGDGGYEPFGEVLRNQSGRLIMTDGLGRIFHDSENPTIEKEYLKSPILKIYSTMRDYVINIISKFKKQKDISSKL
ncbi:MAG: hypothetical protein AABX84_03275 [Nanoarchaeota archaeon]